MKAVGGVDEFSLQGSGLRLEFMCFYDRDEREAQMVWERCFQNNHNMFTALTECAGALNVIFLFVSLSEITLSTYILVYNLFLHLQLSRIKTGTYSILSPL